MQADCRNKDNSDTLDSDTSCVFQGKLCGPVASTMDEDMFAMVVSRWHMYAEGAKETKDWKSLTVTGSLFKEMVLMFIF
jgi:timeless